MYEAWDTAIDAPVALKIIRTDSLPEDGAETLRRRFKQELKLARQVTHPNVVRIHDLGESGDVAYITMALVDGVDLGTYMRREPLSISHALDLARQMASGLVAAHDAGVIHRDLKPGNIMVTRDGRALIMDFGIARSLTETTAAPVTGQGHILGTLGYMAPEQAAGAMADERADVYALGLILYEMLGGRRQSGPSGVNDLLQRMQQAPTPLHLANELVPEAVSFVVARCLEPDPAHRYQRMADVLAGLDGSQPVTVPTVTTAVAGRAAVMRPRAFAALAAAVVVLIATIGYSRSWFALRDESMAHTASDPATVVAVLPFRNASGDAVLEPVGALLTQVVATGLGQAASIRVVDRSRVTQVMRDLRLEASAPLSDSDLVRVGDFTGATHFISGQFARIGGAFRIDATVEDSRRSAPLALTAQGANESQLVDAAMRLVDDLRQQLTGGSARAIAEMQAASWRPSTTSIVALQRYSNGVDFRLQGRNEAALEEFKAAVAADGGFALALSALASVTAATGREADAVTLSTRAAELARNLPVAERSTILAAHYRLTGDLEEATEAYEMLVKTIGSPAAHYDLGLVHELAGRFDDAYREFAAVLSVDPKNVDALLATGRIEIRRGRAADSLEPLAKALPIAVQLNNDNRRADILQATGIAYKTMNRLDEALRNYQESLAIKRRINDRRGMAASFGELAQVAERLGQLEDAERMYRSALETNRELGNRTGVAAGLLNLASLLADELGRTEEALPMLREVLQLHRDSGNTSGEALALNAIGNAYLNRGDLLNAQTYFERSLELRERIGAPSGISDTLHNIGVTALSLGKTDNAIVTLQRALEWRRKSQDETVAAIDSHALGQAFEAQGRFGAAVSTNSDALLSYRASGRQDYWLTAIAASYARSLSLVGRTAEAATLFDEAMPAARKSNNATLITQILIGQSESASISGDLVGAKTLSEQAVRESARVADASMRLFVALTDAALAARRRPSAVAAAALARISRDATAAAYRPIAIAADVERIDTLARAGRHAESASLVDARLQDIEGFGNRFLTARTYFARGETRRALKHDGYPVDYAKARELLRVIGSEAGAESFLRRRDVDAMYRECEKWAAPQDTRAKTSGPSI